MYGKVTWMATSERVNLFMKWNNKKNAKAWSGPLRDPGPGHTGSPGPPFAGTMPLGVPFLKISR